METSEQTIIEYFKEAIENVPQVVHKFDKYLIVLKIIHKLNRCFLFFNLNLFILIGG